MGTTKSQIFTNRQNSIAIISKVLGHPARIAILEHIGKINGCICTDLIDEIGLAQATISQHLKELKSIGIIKGSIEGKKVCYCIDTVRWNEIQDEINEFFSKLNSCCSTC
jgi:DNA-binding transcriptional ArsR family regulator